MLKTPRLTSGLQSISFETNPKSKHPKTVNKFEMQKSIQDKENCRDGICHFGYLLT